MPKYNFILGCCPVCGEEGEENYTHRECSSYEEIDENGDIYCKGCNKCLGFITDLTYTCQNHAQEYAKKIFLYRALAISANNYPHFFIDNILDKIHDKCDN